MVVVVLPYATAWFRAIHDLLEQQREVVQQAHDAGIPPPPPAPPAPSQQMANAILDPAAPTNAFINDAMLQYLAPLHGKSGKVYFTTETPGGTLDLSAGSPSYTAPDDPGIYKLAAQLN